MAAKRDVSGLEMRGLRLSVSLFLVEELGGCEVGFGNMCARKWSVCIAS